jgi:hypothetical protein
MYVECLKTSSNCGEVFEKKKYCISGHPKNVAHQLASLYLSKLIRDSKT